MVEKLRGGSRSALRSRGPEPARAARNPRAFLGVIAAVLVLGGAGAGIALWRRTRPAAEPVAPPAAAHDPTAGMSTIAAAANAERLYLEGRAYESLPYYRRVAPEMAPGRLGFHLEFAIALENASLQPRIRSEERVRLMLESLDELARLERAVQQPGDHVRVIVTRSILIRVWGFHADAAAELRRALATDGETARAMLERLGEKL